MPWLAQLFESSKKASWPFRASSGDQVKYTVEMFMPLSISAASRRAVQRRLARCFLTLAEEIELIPSAG
jgi:hypothetical protein